MSLFVIAEREYSDAVITNNDMNSSFICSALNYLVKFTLAQCNSAVAEKRMWEIYITSMILAWGPAKRSFQIISVCQIYTYSNNYGFGFLVDTVTLSIIDGKAKILFPNLVLSLVLWCYGN